jgi:hypothetical protein
LADIREEMIDPTADEIINAIKASGYLMEQEVATSLQSLGFHVQTNRAYQDLEEAKSREIDVWAIQRKYQDEQQKISLFVELICECKNSSNPFVFLSRNKSPGDNELIPEEYLFPVREYHVPIPDSPNSFHIVPPFSHFKLANHNYRFQLKSKSVQFAKIVRDKNSWQANHAGLYDAVFYPLIKALLARKKEISKFREGLIWLFFPVVVTSGKLYEIDTSATELRAQAVEHVSMLRHIKSKNIDGIFNVDFVTQTGLTDFIETKLNPFSQAVEQLVRQDAQLFRKQR